MFFPPARDRSTKIKKYESVNDILVPYYRVSTREQAESGAGIAAQMTVVTGWAAFSEKTLLEPRIDEGKSGAHLDRDELKIALDLVRSGAAGGIVVAKLDRLSRSWLDFAQLVDEAFRDGWNIVALDLGVDLSTPSGEMLAGMLAMFAQFERRIIAQRTRDALAEKKAQGVRLGRPSSVDEDLLKFILSQFQELDGSYQAVADLLNERQVPTARGGRQWLRGTVRSILMSQDAQKMIQKLGLAS